MPSRQLSGARIKPCIHLRRRYPEPANPGLAAFYQRLLECLKLESWPEDWTLLEVSSVSDESRTSNHFLCFGWSSNGELEVLAVVNFSDHQGQCRVKLPFPSLCEHDITLRDLLSDAVYHQRGSELFSSGLYLDMPNWQFHLFKIEHAS